LCVTPLDFAPRAAAAAVLALTLGQVPLASACTVQRLHLMTPSLNDPAQVGMVGHVDNGTKADEGSYRAELVVSQALVDDIAASLAGGCSQWIHHAGSGTIVLMGIATGSFSAKTQLQWIPASTGIKQKMATWKDSAAADTGGALGFAHDATLKKKHVKALAVGDLLRLSGKAVATGTIINGGVFDQVQSLYGWSGLTPYLEILVP
jgi:hypothetical protein